MNGAKPYEYPEMPTHRKKAMLKIWGGASDMHFSLTALHFLDCHAPRGRLDYMLGWLIKNKITGQKFQQYLKHDCKGSNLELLRNLTMRIQKDSELKPIYADKEFRT